MNVYFQNVDEVLTFCEQLFYYHKCIHLKWKEDVERGHCLSLYDSSEGFLFRKCVADACTDVFIKYYLNQLIVDVIKEKFYYKDMADIERIFEFTHWIMTSEDRESEQVRKFRNQWHLIQDLFMSEGTYKNEIHFSGLIHFRKKMLKEKLVFYVGIGIDEFKREEEHLNFIDLLREHIRHEKTFTETIHVVMNVDFHFYDGDGKIISHMMLRTMMYEKPLYMYGLDMDDMKIAPLVILSPKHICLYGDDPQDANVISIQNIFQDKVTFYKRDMFPFS